MFFACVLLAAGITAAQSVTTTTSCAFNDVSQSQPTDSCSVVGTLTAARPIATYADSYDYETCAELCRYVNGCESFSVENRVREIGPQPNCTLYSEPLDAQGLVVSNDNEGLQYYDESCFDINCYVVAYNPTAPFYIQANSSDAANGKYAVVATEEDAAMNFVADSPMGASTFKLSDSNELIHVSDGRIANVPTRLGSPEVVKFSQNVTPIDDNDPNAAISCYFEVNTTSQIFMMCSDNTGDATTVNGTTLYFSDSPCGQATGEGALSPHCVDFFITEVNPSDEKSLSFSPGPPQTGSPNSQPAMPSASTKVTPSSSLKYTSPGSASISAPRYSPSC